jgi:hypothetical protein
LKRLNAQRELLDSFWMLDRIAVGHIAAERDLRQSPALVEREHSVSDSVVRVDYPSTMSPRSPARKSAASPRSEWAT